MALVKGQVVLFDFDLEGVWQILLTKALSVRFGTRHNI
jgi:hypothetical protein